ncbi:MAG TPA: hypothetical protein VKT21_02555 [Thermoplasmata archaeon]|nr:hypothetical protein [Thermoplasmata archaeon]
MTAAIALIALVLVIGIIPSQGAHATGSTLAAAPAAVAHTPSAQSAHPPATGPISISTTITSKFSTNGLPYFTLPYNITWNVSITNATLDSNFTQVLNISFVNSILCPLFFPCLMVYQDHVNPAWVANATSTSGSYYYPLTLGNLTAQSFLGFTLPQGQWIISIWDNYDDGAGNTSNFQTQQSAFIALTPPAGTIYQPVANANITAGNTVIAGNYSGYFVATANVTVYNASGSTVLVDPVYAPGPGQHAWAASWAAITPGAYKIVLTLTAVWHQTFYVNTSVTVVAGVPLTYLNSTGLDIGGLGSGGSAVVLVLIGAIIGMIVMALVGRSIWGGTKPSPAQPWSAQPPATTDTTSTSGSNMSGGSGTGSGGTTGNQNPPS